MGRLRASRAIAPQPVAKSLRGAAHRSIRRECLDHVLVLSEPHLRRTLTRYFAYYHGARTHLSLDKDPPDGRPVEPPELGPVIPISEVGRCEGVNKTAERLLDPNGRVSYQSERVVR
jgi:hypothetical protein